MTTITNKFVSTFMTVIMLVMMLAGTVSAADVTADSMERAGYTNPAFTAGSVTAYNTSTGEYTEFASGSWPWRATQLAMYEQLYKIV